MGWTKKYTGPGRYVSLGSLTLTGANESTQVATPNGLTAAFLQNARAFASSFAMPLTENLATAEVWRPLGVNFIYTTSTTVTAPAVILRKNGVSALTAAGGAGGGIATGSIQTAPFSEFKPFTAYTFATDDVAGDKWSVLVSTTATAGVATILLYYVPVVVSGISDGVTTL